MAKQKIQSLQVFRGLAAVAVVAHHSAISTGAFIAELPGWASTMFGMGYLGVDFFFVLSGFIIMYAHFDDAGIGTAVKPYVFKRLVRIFPAYLPISLALISLYFVVPGFSAAQGRNVSLLSSLFLMPADGSPALSVAWTLVHELTFYFVFMLYFVSKRWLVLGLIMWAAMILVITQVYLPAGWLRYPLSTLNIEFMFGVMAAWFFKRMDARSGSQVIFFVVAGLLLVCSGLFVIWQDEMAIYPRLLFSFGLTMIVLGFSLRDLYSRPHWPVLLLYLGNASYSIYLIHNPLLSVTQRLAAHLGWTWAVGMLFGVTCSIFAGYIYYLVVERPALGFFNNYFRTTHVRNCRTVVGQP